MRNTRQPPWWRVRWWPARGWGTAACSSPRRASPSCLRTGAWQHWTEPESGSGWLLLGWTSSKVGRDTRPRYLLSLEQRIKYQRFHWRISILPIAMTAPERGPNHHILAKDNILVIVCSSIFCFLNVVTELTLSYWNQLSPAASVEREGEWRPQPPCPDCLPGSSGAAIRQTHLTQCWISRQYQHYNYVCSNNVAVWGYLSFYT